MEDMVMNGNFWKGKKVLITGHTGFKGSWLSLWLQGKGTHVVGYALHPPTKTNLFEVAKVAEGMESVFGDICNLEHLKSIIDEHEPEIVFHMAAQSLVRYSYNNPVETYSTNVIGTVNVLEALRHSKSVRVVIVVTSDKCYKNREWLWGYRENEPMGGYDPYSSSKGCAELVVSAYNKSFFSQEDNKKNRIALASVRAGNVIGGGDWAEDRLIPDIMKSFMENKSVIIRSPNAYRPWQYILDPLNGYLCLAEKLWENGTEFSGAWNFGPNDGDICSVYQIVNKLKELWGEGAHMELDKKQHLHEATYLKLDCSKANNLLKWSQKLNLYKAMDLIVSWYRCYQQKKDMRKVTEDEILLFERLQSEE